MNGPHTGNRNGRQHGGRQHGERHHGGPQRGGQRRGGERRHHRSGRGARDNTRLTGSDIDLSRLLRDIDSSGYGGYKRLNGGRFELSVPAIDGSGSGSAATVALHIDHVQADPYAPPSTMRVSVSRRAAGIPEELFADRISRTAATDFLARRWMRQQKKTLSGQHRGKGGKNSPRISIGTIGQQVLERSSVVVTEDYVEARIDVGLPAAGRRILGREAEHILCDVIPQIAAATFLHGRFSDSEREGLEEHVVTLREQEHLRAELARRRLVTFVADGAVLPRRAGDSDLPMPAEHAEPFRSPESLRVSVDLPTGRTVTGMGVPEGITVIVGGGYHGKSTLLRAIERGVYPHISGDGREWVVTRPDAVTVRAEDGRPATGVNISPFIDNLPAGTDTRSFTTSNASGSTSQATNLVEAVEAGASALLIDEDTSATNFMIRDDRMRALIPSDREPITPFVDRIRPLFEQEGVSTILVAGGSGAFFGVADHVIALDAYVPEDVTEKAHSLYDASSPTNPRPDTTECVSFTATPRIPDPASLHLTGKFRSAKVRGADAIQYGDTTIDLGLVSQLVDPEQTNAIGLALDRMAELARDSSGSGGGEGLSATDLVAEIDRRVDEEGLNALSHRSDRVHPGHLARPRRQELHAALNRYRNLRLR